MKLEERVRKVLNELVGDDYRQWLNVKVRAADLYWLINLAEDGLKERAKVFKGDKAELDMMDRLNLVSIRENVECVIEAIQAGKVIKTKK